MEHRLGIASPLRCAAVGLTALALAATLACVLLPDLASIDRDLDRAPFDQVLVCSAEVALLGSGWWLCLLAVLVSVRAAAGAAPTRGVPRWWRRVVLAGCGVALVGSVAAPAHADSGRPLPDRVTAATHVSNL
ncbi:MAG: hypothetical protein ACRDOM_08595, partial [Nocardioides sp.]